MLTVAYCRVSTEEQAEEGFSIEGQANRLRSYGELREIGPVTVIEDPGRSGKDLQRPGLQQVLAMVEAGHVSHVLVWRLDRLSRNLADLILLADTFGQAEVALHSFSENLDLSSATGRMFYNILGTFAQFYREQLSENVRMGMHQAVLQGRWINRPPTGYDLLDGLLVPNDDAPRVREIFRLRAAGEPYRTIGERTGIEYSTVCAILKKRTYLGETLLNGEWFPGSHEPIVSAEDFEAAQRGFVPGRRRGSDLLSGKVFCGICRKRMAVETNGTGRLMYRCHNRGRAASSPVGRTWDYIEPLCLAWSSWHRTENCKKPSTGSSPGPAARMGAQATTAGGTAELPGNGSVHSPINGASSSISTTGE